MSKSFGGLCKPGQRKQHCLSLLDDVIGLSEWDKLGVSLGVSLDPLRESISKAVENTLAPQIFYTVIATGLISWVVLAANPEPVFTKAAAIVSALLLIYLGVETFLSVVDASRELKRATDKATTPEELVHAGQRFANRVGPGAAWLLGGSSGGGLTGGHQPGEHWTGERGGRCRRHHRHLPACHGGRHGGSGNGRRGSLSRCRFRLHTQLSAFYSRKRFFITNSENLTVREWLSTQSFEAQRQFGLQAIENIRKGIWR